jgi:hypothetical protein
VTTPRARSASVREATLLYAPRILNAPTGWSDSGFNQVVSSQCRSGVRVATPRIRSAASRISSIETMCGSAARIGQ